MAWNKYMGLKQPCSGSTAEKRYSQISCWRKEYKAYLILHDETIAKQCNCNRLLRGIVESPAFKRTKLNWTSSWVACCDCFSSSGCLGSPQVSLPTSAIPWFPSSNLTEVNKSPPWWAFGFTGKIIIGYWRQLMQNLKKL